MDIRGTSWQTSAYAGLRKFYQGKGFNPNSQDVARHLGEPLYQVTPPKSEPSVDKVSRLLHGRSFSLLIIVQNEDDEEGQNEADEEDNAGDWSGSRRIFESPYQKMARRNNYLRL
jgi:hypothetical protein